ncbi:outer membrane lipoprotein-sorting protein [Spirochaetia bacterium]|nr:outer membrane lipoprotein-sorting protein [Spirochaetia bacterium]
MKKIVLVVSLLLTGFTLLAAQDAEQIVDSSRKRIKAVTISTKSTMNSVNSRNVTTSRELIQLSKNGSNGSRIAIEFVRPAKAAGNRLLTQAVAGKPNDVWTSTPGSGSSNAVAKLPPARTAQKLLDSDFSYDDIALPERAASLDSHKILREENLNGKDCYVIESTPQDSSYQYGKMIQWIDKANYVNYKIELYDKKAVQLKTYEVLEFKEVEGRLSPWKIKMTTIKANTSTTIEAMEMRYDVDIPEGQFSQEWLATGKHGSST